MTDPRDEEKAEQLAGLAGHHRDWCSWLPKDPAPCGCGWTERKAAIAQALEASRAAGERQGAEKWTSRAALERSFEEGKVAGRAERDGEVENQIRIRKQVEESLAAADASNARWVERCSEVLNRAEAAEAKVAELEREVLYEQERNQNNVAMLTLQMKELQEALRKIKDGAQFPAIIARDVLGEEG